MIRRISLLLFILIAFAPALAQSDQRRRDFEELKSIAAEFDILSAELERNELRRIEIARSFVTVKPTDVDFVIPINSIARRVYECCKLNELIGDEPMNLRVEGAHFPSLNGLQIGDLPDRSGYPSSMKPEPIGLNAGVFRISGYSASGMFCGSRRGDIESIADDDELISAVADVPASNMRNAPTEKIDAGKHVCGYSIPAEPGTVHLLRMAVTGDRTYDGDAIYAFQIVRAEPYKGVLVLIKELRNLGKVENPPTSQVFSFSDDDDDFNYTGVFERGMSIKLRELLDANGFKSVTFEILDPWKIRIRGQVKSGEAVRVEALTKRLMQYMTVLSEVIEL